MGEIKYTSAKDFLKGLKNGTIDSDDLAFASEDVRNDSALMLYAIYESERAGSYLGETLRNDPVFAKKLIKKSSLSLKYLSESLRNDPQIVFPALQDDQNANSLGDLFEHIGDKLKHDAEFIQKILKDRKVLEGDSHDEKMFVLASKCKVPFAVIEEAYSMIEGTEDEEDDLDYSEAEESDIATHLKKCGIKRMMRAIDDSTPSNLEYAEHFQNNKYVVWRAVKRSAFWGLRHAGEYWQNNEEMVHHAIDNLDEIDILRFFGPSLHNNGTVIERLIAYSPDTMEHLNEEYVANAIDESKGCWSQPAFVNKMVARAPQVLEILPKSIHPLAASEITAELKQEILQNVQNNGMKLRTVRALQDDHDVVLAAVQQDGRALEYASDALQGSRDIVLAAVQQNRSALEYAASDLKQDRDFFLSAVQIDGFALQYASAELQNDRDVVLAAIQNKPRALKYASPALRNDPEIQRIAGK